MLKSVTLQHKSRVVIGVRESCAGCSSLCTESAQVDAVVCVELDGVSQAEAVAAIA